MRPVLVLSVLIASTFPACKTPDAAPAAEPQQAAQGGGDKDKKSEAEKKADERQAKEKELRNKKRELDYARIALQTGAIDREMRTLAADRALANARHEFEKATADLDVFTKAQSAREKDEKQLGIDSQTYRAEEAKDEQAELESMYKDDEFAKKTKELVLKRGKRQVELSDRSLALAKREQEQLEKHTLPDRERDLRHKLEEARLDVGKAELEQRKAALELDVQRRQAEDKVHDLEQDVKELEQKLAKETP
jgi:hypothetical protein